MSKPVPVHWASRLPLSTPESTTILWHVAKLTHHTCSWTHPGKLFNMCCASVPKFCADRPGTCSRDWCCHPPSFKQQTQLWPMNWAPKTSINLAPENGCAYRILEPGSETEWRKAGLQFKLGRWRSLLLEIWKNKLMFILPLLREKTEGTLSDEGKSCSQSFLALRPQAVLPLEFKFYSFIYKLKDSDL